MNEEIKAGDVVSLKSDQFVWMTVEEVTGNTANCSWFANGLYYSKWITIVALIKQKEKGKTIY